MTPLLSLQEIAEGITNQASLVNQALREFEARTVRVLSKTTTTPPGSPVESDSYIIPVGSPGSWLGASNQIATYIGGIWLYYTPVEGVTVWVNDLNAIYTYDGSAWVASAGGGFVSPLTTKGDVHTYSTVDARLAVGANDTVLTADSAQATGLKWAAPAATGIVKWGGAAGRVGDAFTISTTPATTVLVEGDTFIFSTISPNAGTSTLKVDGTAIKTIVKDDGSTLVADDLMAPISMVTYNASPSQFRLHRSTPSSFRAFTNPVTVLDATAATHPISYRQLPRQNLFINAGMRQAQRGVSFAAVADGAYTLDRLLYRKVGAMVHTVSQDTDVPTVAQAGMLIPYSFKLVLTTADTAIAAGDYCTFSQRIEGYNYQLIAQRSFTIGFWVKATLAGIYSVSFTNSVPDRSYVSNFTISAANTWELKTITVAASPSAGTWLYTNGLGLSVTIVLAAGTTFHTTANAWQTGNFLGTASNVNGVNTGATNFWFTAPVINPGTVAAPFELPIYISEEIAACQRYFWKTFPQGTAPAQNAGTAGSLAYRVVIPGVANYMWQLMFPVTMRTAGSAITYNPSAANNKAWNTNTAADSGTPTTVSYDNGLQIDYAQVAGDTSQHVILLHAAVDSEL